MSRFAHLLVYTAVASLTFGLALPELQLSGGRAPYPPADFVLVMLAAADIQQDRVQSQD
jgi:hypothetical protein